MDSQMQGYRTGTDSHGVWATWEPYVWRYLFYYEKGEVHDTYDHVYGSTLVNSRRSQHQVFLHPWVDGKAGKARREHVHRLMWQAAHGRLLNPGDWVRYANGDNWDKRASNLTMTATKRQSALVWVQDTLF